MQINIILALLIAIAYSIAAYLSWRVFFFYGTTPAATLIVLGYIKIAISWGLLNIGAQISTHDLKMILTSISLTGILAGAINVCLGLGNIYWYNIRGK